ncbi:hypothetical protein Ancab_011810 [Ancistrocladus abbreviatus]
MSSIPPVELWPALQPTILNDLESLDVGRVENIQREGRYTVRIEKAPTIPFESLQGELTSVELRHFSLAEKLKGSHFVLGAIRKIELVIEEEHTCVYVYEDFDFTLKETIIDSSYKYLVEEERKGASDCTLHVDYLQLLKSTEFVKELNSSIKRFQWRKILTQKIKHEELLEVFYYEAEEQNVEVEDGPCSLYDSEGK